MAKQDKTQAQIDAEAEAAARAEDERIRKHGQSIAQKALAAVNQPTKPPMNLAEVCAVNSEGGGRNVIVAVPTKIGFVFDYPHDTKPFGKFWGSRVIIPAGPQEMPEVMTNHWWIIANGVKPYTAPPILPKDSFSRDEMQAAIKKAVDEALEAATAPGGSADRVGLRKPGGDGNAT
jgi:hypothetical protein